MATKLTGASLWEEELYGHLTSHEENEQDLLVEYRTAAERSRSDAFCYLTGLIVEDEIRHHRVFGQLASALRSDAELRSDTPAVPRLDHWGPDPAAVVELTESLLDKEYADSRELRRLAAHLEDLEGVSLWPLLVKLMEMDTAKHIEILTFVKRHAQRTLSRPRGREPRC